MTLPTKQPNNNSKVHVSLLKNKSLIFFFQYKYCLSNSASCFSALENLLFSKKNKAYYFSTTKWNAFLKSIKTQQFCFLFFVFCRRWSTVTKVCRAKNWRSLVALLDLKRNCASVTRFYSSAHVKSLLFSTKVIILFMLLTRLIPL